MAIPADAVLEAVIEDIARADAPATVLARTEIENPGQGQIPFSITYDPADLDARAIYNLRVTIRRNGQIMFTTDRITRVLDGSAIDRVEVRLVRASPSSGADRAPLGAHGLRLPASFSGILPCANCEGVRHHLDVWPDQVYHMSREWFGRAEGPLRRDEVGRWYADPARSALVLHGASEMPLFWEVKGTDRLRQMDMAGNPIASDLPYELKSASELSPLNLEGMFLVGMMTYQADAAMFEECLTGRVYPIAGEGEYLALERAYLDARAEPGAPLLVHVEGGVALRPSMDGTDRMHVIVDRFIKTVRGETCSRQTSTASLTNTYWRIEGLMGQTVVPMGNRREPHLVLLEESGSRFRATVGCNQLIGGYEREGDSLNFGVAASTMMACPPPIDGIERRLVEALSKTRRTLLQGNKLELLSNDGTVLANLKAIYIR